MRVSIWGQPEVRVLGQTPFKMAWNLQFLPRTLCHVLKDRTVERLCNNLYSPFSKCVFVNLFFGLYCLFSSRPNPLSAAEKQAFPLKLTHYVRTHMN